jgi:hypothetical protein
MNEGQLITDSKVSEDVFEDQPRVGRSKECAVDKQGADSGTICTFACQAEMSGEPLYFAHYVGRIRSVAVEQVTI